MKTVMVGEHPRVKALKELIEKVAPYKTTCMIVGESGTGKELVAQMVHELSPRKHKRFISINCGAIPENLLESELFGHVKGAFTGASSEKKGLFEEAHGGTLFLDEIAEMPLEIQAKLLRVLQENEIRKVGGVASVSVNVRILTATHKNIEEMIENQTFREDLFYRLNVMPLYVPSLRERKSDIGLLVDFFLNQKSKKPKAIDHGVLKKLQAYDYPGNIRELENIIERALIMSQDTDRIEVEHLPEKFHKAIFENRPLVSDPQENLSIKKRVASLEVELIKKALIQTRGNRTHAAKILEISHRALLYKLKEYGLSDFYGNQNTPQSTDNKALQQG